MMAAEKRPASNAFGSSQLVVKRQKSNVNLSDGKAITVSNGNAAGGALTQAVSLPEGLITQQLTRAERRMSRSRLMEKNLGATH